MSLFQEITSGLAFPEGPIAMPDGSVIVVEMFGPYLTKVHANGQIERIATIPGGPNGAAIGPDGRIYICNNGAAFDGVWRDGNWDLWYSAPDRYRGGSIQAYDMTSKELKTLYTACDGLALSAPNDWCLTSRVVFISVIWAILTAKARRLPPSIMRCPMALLSAK